MTAGVLTILRAPLPTGLGITVWHIDGHPWRPDLLLCGKRPLEAHDGVLDPAIRHLATCPDCNRIMAEKHMMAGGVK